MEHAALQGSGPLVVLPLVPVASSLLGGLERSGCVVLQAGDGAAGAVTRLAGDQFAPADLAGVSLVITNGSRGLLAQEMALLPHLRWVLCTGVGYEGVDVRAATVRGIAVSNTPGINGETVADHAMALLLAVSRNVVALDRLIRDGQWESLRKPLPAPHGRTLGLLGFGGIGQAIARRARGFGMTVLYTSRSANPDGGADYVGSLAELACRSDYLVVACPGGASTRHLVNAEILTLLGPTGFLINIGRGSVVDTAALVDALKRGRIAGAALDVFEGEPELPAELVEAPDLILTPHIAGRSPQTSAAQQSSLELYIKRCIEGKTPPNLVHG